MINSPDNLKHAIESFLSSPFAKSIACGARLDPRDAEGELYVGLASALNLNLDNLTGYVWKYGPHYLRRYIISLTFHGDSRYRRGTEPKAVRHPTREWDGRDCRNCTKIGFVPLESDIMDTRLKSPHDELELKEWVQQLSSLPNHLREALQAWKVRTPQGFRVENLPGGLGVVADDSVQTRKLKSCFRAFTLNCKLPIAVQVRGASTDSNHCSITVGGKNAKRH